jgi:hypothetical protein
MWELNNLRVWLLLLGTLILTKLHLSLLASEMYSSLHPTWMTLPQGYMSFDHISRQGTEKSLPDEEEEEIDVKEFKVRVLQPPSPLTVGRK